MTRLTQLAELARLHWERHLPRRTAELRRTGMWERASWDAAQFAVLRIEILLLQGLPRHKADMMALKEFILLPPEDAGTTEPQEQDELPSITSAWPGR
jgi:hypothetical protein